MLENASLRESVAGMEKQLINLLNEKQAILIQQQVPYFSLIEVHFLHFDILIEPSKMCSRS